MLARLWQCDLMNDTLEIEASADYELCLKQKVAADEMMHVCIWD